MDSVVQKLTAECTILYNMTKFAGPLSFTNVDTISFADIGTIFAIKYNRRKTSK
ncbi:hypothetical protein SPX_44350 [Sporomusa paucivorans]